MYRRLSVCGMLSAEVVRYRRLSVCGGVQQRILALGKDPPSVVFRRMCRDCQSAVASCEDPCPGKDAPSEVFRRMCRRLSVCGGFLRGSLPWQRRALGGLPQTDSLRYARIFALAKTYPRRSSAGCAV